MREDEIDFIVLEHSSKKVLIEVRFKESFPYFEGHFNGFPILPALLQVDFVMTSAKKFFSLEREFKNIPSMKFMNPIFPEMKILLELRWDEIKEQLQFKYLHRDKVCSQGSLRG